MQQFLRLYARFLAGGTGERQTPVAIWLLVLCPIAVLIAVLTALPGIQAHHQGIPFDGIYTYVGSDKYGHTSVTHYPIKPILTTDAIVIIVSLPLFFSALAFVLGWFGREAWSNGD